MTSICVIKMIDNHLYIYMYIPTTRLNKEKHNRKGSKYRVYMYPFNSNSIGTNVLSLPQINVVLQLCSIFLQYII